MFICLSSLWDLWMLRKAHFSKCWYLIVSNNFSFEEDWPLKKSWDAHKALRNSCQRIGYFIWSVFEGFKRVKRLKCIATFRSMSSYAITLVGSIFKLVEAQQIWFRFRPPISIHILPLFVCDRSQLFLHWITQLILHQRIEFGL